MGNTVPYIMSAPRCGSTFIGQVMKMIFGNINATHDYHSESDVIVFRDFLDSAISHYRVLYDKEKDFIITNKDQLDKIIKDYSKFSGYIRKYVDTDLGKLYFVYEFHIKNKEGNNYDVIFSKIEERYKVAISDDLKKEIISNTNLNLNKERSNKLQSFTQWDKRTMIHGGHVHTGGHNIWKNHISPDLHDYYQNSPLKDDYEYCIKKLGLDE